MNLEKQLLEKIVKIYPKFIRDYYLQLYKYAGLNRTIASRLGMLTLICIIILILDVIVSLIFFYEYLIWSIPGGILLILSILGLDYFLLFFAIEERKERIESMLPDFLHLISSNVRAGLTPYQSFKTAAREEFGVLKEEVDIATTKALGPRSFKKLLSGVADKIHSTIFKRVFNLFSTSMETGSHIAELLEDSAKDIAETQGLKKDLTTGTKTYSMFILFTVVIGSPLLYSISIQFVDIMSTMQDGPAALEGDSFGMGLMAGEISITFEFIYGISIFMIIATSIFSSILLGVIKEGNKRYGLRYAPMICVASFGVFMVCRYFVGSFF